MEVLLSKLRKIAVEKGDVYHGMKEGERGYHGFGELYFSRVDYSETKGWKKHNRLTLNLMVPAGEVRFVLFDSDPETGLPTNLVADYRLGADINHQRLTVPPGIWMAFQGCSDKLNLVANVIAEHHDPAESQNIDLSAVSFDWQLCE